MMRFMASLSLDLWQGTNGGGSVSSVPETTIDRSERVIWQSYPSWRQFSWLYFFTLWTGLRGYFLMKLDVAGWELWMVGVVILLGVVVILRYWAKYMFTAHRVVLQNGYSGKIIDTMKVEAIKSVEVQQGPIADFLGIGTVVMQEKEPDRRLRFRGITNPGVPVAKLRALMPSQ